MGVTDRGFRTPPSPKQRRDRVILALIREQHLLSLGSYGRPRMTAELNELGLRVGQRRVGRVRRENSPPDCFLILLTARERQPSLPQLGKFKRTTDSDHVFNIAPNLLQQGFTASRPNQKWAGDICLISGRVRGGSIWL